MVNNVPQGLLLPSIKGFDGTNPRNAALMNEMNNNSKLTNLTNIVGGRQKSKKYYGGGFVNPQILPIYSDIGANGQNTVDINNKLAVISTQNASNASYDLKVGQVAGYKNRKRKTKKNKKSRKYHKKSRRYHKK